MPSIYEQASERVFDELCEADREWLTLTAEVSNGLRRGYYQPREMIDALGQYYFRPSLPEVHSFIQLWTHLHRGDVAVVRLRIGREPWKDSAIDANDEALQDLARRCGKQCEARFWGGVSDHDGYVRMLEPIVLDSVNLVGERFRIAHGGRDSLEFPLEVGTQSWSKTLNMIRTLGLLARWPYDSTYIWLFKMRDEVLDEMQGKVVEILLGHSEQLV